MFDDFEIISTYTLEQAIADGVLIPILSSDWDWLTHGKPVVATAAIVHDVPELELKRMWNAFAKLRNRVKDAGERPLVKNQYNGKTIWIVEDEVSVAYMYPNEY